MKHSKDVSITSFRAKITKCLAPSFSECDQHICVAAAYYFYEND